MTDDDRAYLDWLKTQPSALTGRRPTEPCHVRRVARGAGVGRKPPFWAIPMTHEEHHYSHQHGERETLKRFLGLDLSREDAKAFFDRKAAEYLERWRRLKDGA